MKICNACGKNKPDSEFYVHKTGKRAGKLLSKCKECGLKYQKNKYARRKSGELPTIAVTSQVCGDCGTEKPSGEFGVDHARPTGLKRYCNQCVKDRWYRGRYDISREDYDRMLEEQGGACAICHLPEHAVSSTGEVKPLCVDHDHATGEVRGLLCDDCNVGLGRFRDSRERLLAAVDYLD